MSKETEIRLSVDMDLDADYLKFNLGVITRRIPESDPDCSRPPRYFRWIQVWQVDSIVDKNGEVKALRAERLACFPEQHRNRCDSFRLRGRRVAYALHTNYEFSDRETSLVEILLHNPVASIRKGLVVATSVLLRSPTDKTGSAFEFEMEYHQASTCQCK